MEDLKIVISRGYTRKINLGNYESADGFANYSEEILADTPKEDVQKKSQELFEMAKQDVVKSMNEIKKQNGTLEIDADKMVDIIDKISVGNSILVDDYTNLTEKEVKLVQSVKRAYNRSSLAKSRKVMREKNNYESKN